MLNFPGGPKCKLPPPLPGLVLVPPDLRARCFVLLLDPPGSHECPGCMLPSSLMAICLPLPWSTSFQELLVASALYSLPHHTSHLGLGLNPGSVWITDN